MRRAALGLLGITLSSLLACGGIAQGGGTDSGPEPDGTMSTAKGGSGAGDSFADADTAVGECVEGPLEADADYERCAWLARGRCYLERQMACNCACPHDRDSQCSSGFDRGSSGHVKVSCF